MGVKARSSRRACQTAGIRRDRRTGGIPDVEAAGRALKADIGAASRFATSGTNVRHDAAPLAGAGSDAGAFHHRGCDARLVPRGQAAVRVVRADRRAAGFTVAPRSGVHGVAAPRAGANGRNVTVFDRECHAFGTPWRRTARCAVGANQRAADRVVTARAFVGIEAFARRGAVGGQGTLIQCEFDARSTPGCLTALGHRLAYGVTAWHFRARGCGVLDEAAALPRAGRSGAYLGGDCGAGLVPLRVAAIGIQRADHGTALRIVAAGCLIVGETTPRARRAARVTDGNQARRRHCQRGQCFCRTHACRRESRQENRKTRGRATV